MTSVLAVGVVAAFVLAYGSVVPQALAVAGLLGLLLCLAALRRPLAVLAAGLAGVVVVPVYYGRNVGGLALGVTPAVAVALVLLPVALLRLREVRLNALDAAVGAFLLLRAASYLLNYSTGAGATLTLLLHVALVYVVVRVLSLEPRAPWVLARVLVGGGAALSVLAIAEHRGMANPFFTMLPAGYQAEAWARPELRFEAVRAEASFGHPIALGMFLALAAVLALGLAVAATRTRARWALLAAAGLMAQGVIDTLSRGPLLVLVLGVLLLFLAELPRFRARVLLPVAAVAVAVAVAGSGIATVSLLREASKGDTREARSAEYRLRVLDVVRDPDELSWLGRETADTGGVTASASTRVGLKSVDNEFALVYIGAGALAAAAFVAIGACIWRVALLRGLSPVDRAWGIASAVAVLNLATVALITQHASVFWVATAMLGGVWQRDRVRRAEPAVHRAQAMLGETHPHLVPVAAGVR